MKNDDGYNRLLFNTEIRRLPKSKCLDCFYSLLVSVLDFLESKDNDLLYNLIVSKSVIACTTDFFAKLYKTNLKLQDNVLNLIKIKILIFALAAKILLYKQI